MDAYFSALNQTYVSPKKQQLNNFFIRIFDSIAWVKIRTSYATNSWIYTTNHKRIAVNYFNFVLVSGTAGMGLATVIRLEFAYPGVGVLAGDSLQYLSIATAHGVIMVFFMIMPAIFGAFGNFLLPTQLGVHDVAFPRLNSAAFWFLPGGLIMLCQLICVDRRYQRMNCFNIRELQSMLKRKYFVDLVNSNDHKELLSSSVIGLRFKSNGSKSSEVDQSLFYNFGTSLVAKNKTFSVAESNSTKTLDSFSSQIISSLLSPQEFNLNFYTINSLILELVQSILNLFRVKNIPMSTRLTTNDVFTLISVNTSFVSSPNYTNSNNTVTLNTDNTSFSSENITSSDLSSTTINSLSEMSNNTRFNRFSNPLLGYNYKHGNYIGKWESINPHLFNSIGEISRGGIRKPSWFFSETFDELLNLHFQTFEYNFTKHKNLGLSSDWYVSHTSPTFSFFNVMHILSVNPDYISMRWVSLNTLNQKFCRMFSSITMQQRILSNWRQLKFSREAWRCKLLAARHQNSLYKRFTSEEGFILSVDRNAKDLLPGWAMVTPFSARTRFTAIGKTDVGLMGVFIAINASIVSSANFLVTYRYLSTLSNRKMRDARSFFAEGLITASWMMIAANPMLAIGILMLISDRHWQTSFFDYAGGGDTVLFQHMFWFFGHPEVYIIMLPVFGFTNTMLSFYLRKRVSARASLLYSMYTIAFLGFFVWGHHMYMVGLSHTTRMLFSTLTVMISVPAATKLMHWCVTIVNSAFVMELPLLFALTFTFFFVCGGVSGMCVAHTGMDVLFHDTFYVIGHFHVMFAGAAMLGIFGAFYFYFPAIYGVKYSRIYAYIHYVYYLLGQLLTVMPMFWLGYCGMPRRVLDYPSSLGGWHSMASAGHLLSVTAIISFYVMIYDSVRQAKPAIRNNFGVGRFNTRLNFYLFEAHRLSFIQRKSFHFHRFININSKDLGNLNLLRINDLDTTLFSYVFVKKN